MDVPRRRPREHERVPDDTPNAFEDAEIDEVRADVEPPEEVARELPQEGHPGDPASYLRP